MTLPDRETSAVSTAARHRASPRVRHRARELGVDLHTVRGSGPSGRVLLADLARPQDPPASAAAAFAAVETGCPPELAGDRAGLLAVLAAAAIEGLRAHAPASGIAVDTASGRVHIADAADLTVAALRDRLANALTPGPVAGAPLRLVDGDQFTLLADPAGPGELLVLGAGRVETRVVANGDGSGLALRPRLTLTASDGGLGLPVLRAVLAHIDARLSSVGTGARGEG